MNKTKRPLSITQTKAIRYVNNAIEILDTKGKLEDYVYQNKKYVRMAGRGVYTGVLQALRDAGFIELKGGKPADIMDYQEALGKRNRKMLQHFIECYEQLHLVAGCDGYGHKKHLQIAFRSAKAIIFWAARHKREN